MKKNNQIHVRAEFTIEKGKIEEFKKLILDMSRMVENNEPDTINYQFYLNRCETKCMVHETYTNSESVSILLAPMSINDNGDLLISWAEKELIPKIFNNAKIMKDF